MKKIKLTKDIKRMCADFSEEVLETNVREYARRNQTDRDLIKRQIYEGKLAEWGVYKYFVLKGRDCTAPDMTIYKKKHKSFDSDLEMEGFHIHVKSQNERSAKRYGYSWVFQASDPLFKKATNKDICVFCLTTKDEVVIILEEEFKDLKFGDPKLPRLKGIKKVMYLKDNQ